MNQQAFVQPQRHVQSSKQTASGILQHKCDKCSVKKTDFQRSPEAQYASTHAFMEPGFAHDFSQIPVHSRSSVRIQAKLTVNTPGDVFEQEADRIADQVLSAPGHPVSGAPPRIQRLSGQPSGSWTRRQSA